MKSSPFFGLGRPCRVIGGEGGVGSGEGLAGHGRCLVIRSHQLDSHSHIIRSWPHPGKSDLGGNKRYKRKPNSISIVSWREVSSKWQKSHWATKVPNLISSHELHQTSDSRSGSQFSVRAGGRGGFHSLECTSTGSSTNIWEFSTLAIFSNRNHATETSFYNVFSKNSFIPEVILWKLQEFSL